MARPRMVRVGIDLDGTLAWTDNNAFLNWLETKSHPINHAMYAITGSWSDATGWDNDQLMRWYTLYYHLNKPLLLPTPGSIEALCQIRKIAGSCIVTARGESIAIPTRRSIARAFPGHKFRNFFFGCPGRKGEIMRENNIRYLIEDTPEEGMRAVTQWPEAVVIAMPNRNAPWSLNHHGIIVPEILRQVDCRNASPELLGYVYTIAWQQVTSILFDLIASAKKEVPCTVG